MKFHPLEGKIFIYFSKLAFDLTAFVRLTAEFCVHSSRKGIQRPSLAWSCTLCFDLTSRQFVRKYFKFIGQTTHGGCQLWWLLFSEGLGSGEIEMFKYSNLPVEIEEWVKIEVSTRISTTRLIERMWIEFPATKDPLT
jgi:hypothetical protein